MRLLFASDSFKGSLSGDETARLLRKAAAEVFGGDVLCREVPVADGGEGTAQAVAKARGGEMIPVCVHGPLMEKTHASLGIFGENEAVFEMASACGLTLIPPHMRDPLKTTSFGAGELLRAALDRGCRRIAAAIGGSATNDGGMGFSEALGAVFLDQYGRRLEGRGENLEKVRRIDLSDLDPRLGKTALTVLCDVKNPLCGETGATFVYGPQKGGTPETLQRLERGMQNYRSVIMDQFGVDPDEIPGTGAAGGLGCALHIFFGAQMRSGIETVLDLTGFDALLPDTDLIVTGEGRCDFQSSMGKVMQGVGDHAKRAGIPAIGICGSLGEGYEEIYQHGIESVITLTDGPMTLEEALSRSEELYYRAAVRAFRMIRAGRKMKG